MSDAPGLKHCIHQDVLASESGLARSFQQGQPFRHVVIDNFLHPDFCQRVCDGFPDFNKRLALNEDGRVGGKAVNEKVRGLGPVFEQLDDLVQSAEFRAMVGRITGIDDLQYDPYYYGGGTHENRQGQDLDPHIDFNYHPISRQHRRLNLIVYLNPEWEDAWAGSLQLHRDPYREPHDDDIVTLTPRMNRCVIFETNEHSWHGFERIDLPVDRQSLSRKSFALYYYTKTRPIEDTAIEHSTVYVERHLPERFQAGMTLEEADLAELKRLLQRRDQHLKRLYRHNQLLHGRINSGVPRPLVNMLSKKAHAFEARTGLRVTRPMRAVWRRLRGRSGVSGE